MPRTRQPILAIDPGTQELGYAILAGKALLASGVLPLRLVAKYRRLKTTRESLVAWVRAYRPRTLVLEHVPRRPLDIKAGLPALGWQLRRFARARSLRIASYSAKTVRRTVVGNGWAGKEDVAVGLSTRFPQLRVHLTHDRKWKVRYWQNMFDAVALALHHQSVTQPPSRSRRSG